MEEVIALSRPEAAVKVNGTDVSTVAYADDLVLFAENADRLRERLAALFVALRAAGLRINASKSASMTMVKDGKRMHLVLTQDQFEVDGSPLKSMSPVDEARYLGLRFTWKGRKAVKHTGKLNEMLGHLTKAPFKPHQRLELLRVFAVPKLVHELTLGVAHRNTLKSLDRMIRERVRHWLRLPKYTTLGFFTHRLG